MAKKTTKKINVQVASKKQGYWVNQDNIRKGERTIKANNNKALVKRNRSGYDYDKTFTGYEQTESDLKLQFAQRLRTNPRGARQDLARLAQNTQEAPVVTARDFFDFSKKDIKGIDTPKTESNFTKLAFEKRVKEIAKEMNISPKSVSFKEMSNKWGETTSKGKVRFTPNLLDKDKQFQDKVIIHELLHVRYHGHARMHKQMEKMYVEKIVDKDKPKTESKIEKAKETKYKSQLAKEGLEETLLTDISTLEEIEPEHAHKLTKQKVVTKPKTESKPSSTKRFIFDNSYSESKLGFTFKDQPVTDFEIINCTPDEEHKITIPRAYHDTTEERTRRWTKKGEYLQVFKVTTALGTEYIASIEHDPRAFTMSTHGKVKKQSFKSMKDAKQWLHTHTKVPISKMATDKVNLQELEGIRPEIPIEFDNLKGIKKATTFSEKKEVLLTDAKETLSVIDKGIKEMNLEIDKAYKESSKPISDTEVKNALLKRAKERYTDVKNKDDWIGDADYKRRMVYEQKRLPEIIKSIKATGKYPTLPDTHKFRSIADFQEEYFLIYAYSPKFKKGELEVSKLKEGIPHTEISDIQAINLTHYHTRNEQFTEAKKQENKNAKFLHEIIKKEEQTFDNYLEGRKNNAVKTAKDHVAYVRNYASGDQNEYVNFIKNIHDAEDLNEAYEHRQSFNEIDPGNLYNRRHRLGNKFRAMAETGKNTISHVKSAKERRIKQSIKDKGIFKLTKAEKDQDFKETSDLTLKSPDISSYEVWEKQPFILDLEGYDDVKGQDPPERFTITKAKKYVKTMGADPDKLSIDEYGTLYYGKERIGGTDTSRPRSEQLRRELMRGIRGGQIPIKESKRKVTLHKAEKSLLNSLGDYTPTVKELDNYLFGNLNETKKVLAQLEEKRLIEKIGDKYKPTQDGYKAQKLMDKMAYPKKVIQKPESKPAKAQEPIKHKSKIHDNLSLTELIKIQQVEETELARLSMHLTKQQRESDSTYQHVKSEIAEARSKILEKQYVNTMAGIEERKKLAPETKQKTPEIKKPKPTEMVNILSGETVESKLFNNLADLHTERTKLFAEVQNNPQFSKKKQNEIFQAMTEIDALYNNYLEGKISTAEAKKQYNTIEQKRKDSVQKRRVEAKRLEVPEERLKDLDQTIAKLHAKYNPLIDKARDTNKKEWSRLLTELDDKKNVIYRQIEREKTKVMNAKKKEVIPKKADTSKSKAIGKELYSDKYNPKKTHLALTTSMNDMQKRRLIQLAMNNSIDTREIDPSLKYDENIEVIKNMVEHQEGKFANREEEERWFEGAVKSTKLNTHFSTTVPKEERDIDLLTTEKKLVTEKDLEHGRKEKMIQKWKSSPLKSDIDIENIDDKLDKKPKTTTKPKPKPKSKRNYVSEYKAVQKQIDQKKLERQQIDQQLLIERNKYYKIQEGEQLQRDLSKTDESKIRKKMAALKEKRSKNYKRQIELSEQEDKIYRPEKDLSQAEQESVREYAKSKNLRYPPVSNRRIDFQKQEIDALADPITVKSQKILLKKDSLSENVYIPDSRFWDTWKEHKEEMKKNSIQPRKIDDNWIVILNE